MNHSRLSLLSVVLITLCNSPLLFAQIELEQTIPGRPTQNWLDNFGATPLRDFTGDGVTDINFFKTDIEGNVVLRVVDSSDYSIWRNITLNEPVTQLLNFVRVVVIGAAELTGSNGFKEIILADKNGRRLINPIVIDAEGTVLWDVSTKTLLGIAQMDVETCDEIVAGNPAVPQVEIWGDKTW